MRIQQFFRALVAHRRVALVVVFAVIAAVGAGVTHLESESGLDEFDIDTVEDEKLSTIESEFASGTNNTTVAQVVLRDDDALDRETLVSSLELQRQIRGDDRIADTLADDQPTTGLANVVARAAIQREHPDATGPSLDRQIAVLESMSDRQLETAVTAVLSNGDSEALAFVPSDYEQGSASASATMVVAFQTTETQAATGQAPDRIVDAQTAMRDLAADAAASDQVHVVGNGVLSVENEQAGADTFRLVGPLALLFVLGVLAVAYRDVVDVAVSLLGVVLVQVWTFGALGWLGVPFNPLLVAIPVLLVGLSIDYSIHVFMRYREQRAATDRSPGAAMSVALAGVGSALVWVTVTTVVGFLSNLSSPVAPIRDLGVISAVGIVGALVVFGGLVPPLKVELDALLGRLGLDRDQSPLGAGGGSVQRALSVGSRAAERAPVVVLVLVVAATAATSVAAADVSTAFEPEDNIPGDPPAWTDSLPEQVAPGDYEAKADMHYVNENFVRHTSRAEFLVEGDVTAPDVLERVAAAERAVADKPVAVTLADGSAQTRSPLAAITRVAATDDEFAAVVASADTDGDGVPDRNIERVYDALHAAAPEEAGRVLDREDGEYESLRLSVAVNPEADGRETTDQMRDVAAVLDGDDVTVTATGDPIVHQQIQDYLLETLLVSFAATLVAVAVIIAGVFRVVHGSATLGLLTVLPVAFAVSWIVGTMRALGFPLSVVTTIVASLTVGIGVDYSIHVSERFRQELERRTVADALAATVRGTGAALLGSAATSAVGFGVLAFALRPTLRQFGIITAIMIAYAFLASVLVLPSLLALWARYAGPEASSVPDSESGATAEVSTD
jgi:predicted RND superfamily exporter protein